MQLINSPVVEDDASTHSSASGSSADMDQSECTDDNNVEEFLEVSTPKQTNKSKKKLVIKIASAFFGVIFSLLLVDLLLYYRMEFNVKTIDAVLSEDSPVANVRMSLVVSSRMLFSSINVNSFECKAFHKAPYDTDEGKYFGSVTNNNKFDINTKKGEFESIDDNFIEIVDMLISDIDFDIMKRSIQDAYMTTEDTASRLRCSFSADINMLGMATVPAPTVHRNFEHNCVDCVTQREFSSTGVFMASVLGSLISESNVESSREGEDNHKRSVFFSENSEEFVFNVHKLFDISGAFGDMTRFTVDVPSSEYVVASKDKEEFWSTTTTPFTVDLVADGGSVLKMDITTTCANVATNTPCKVTDPANNFLDDVWNGDISYEMTSSTRIAKDPTYGDSFKSFNAMKGAGYSTTDHDEDDDDQDENFLESLFDFDFNFDFDINLGKSIDDIKDMEVDINRKLLELPWDFGSLVMKLSGSDVKVVDVKLDWSSGWPGHEGGGFMSNVKLDFLDGEMTVDADINAGSDDMELIVREFVMPSQDLKTSSFVNVTLAWQRNMSTREACIDYKVNWSSEEHQNNMTITHLEQMNNTLNVAYGGILDHGNINGLTLSGFSWSDVDADDYSDDDATELPDGSSPMWDYCKKLSHDAKGGSFIICHSGKDDRFSFTYYDSDLIRVIKLSGAADGKMDFVDTLVEHSWANFVDADVMVKARVTVYDEDLFKFTTFKSLTVHGLLNPQNFDFFVGVEDSRDRDIFLVRAMTGWENLNSLTDMDITETKFLYRTYDKDHFRLELAGAHVHYVEMNDMSLAVDKFALTVDDEKRIDATLKLSYIKGKIYTLIALKLREEEIIYFKVEGVVDYDSALVWDIDMKKILLRSNGKQRVKTNMKANMMEVDDALNDMHMVMTMSCFLEFNTEEMLTIQKMRADLIADDDFNKISASSSIQGVVDGEDVINATLFVDRMESNWTISTNNFDVRHALVVSLAPTSAPTVYQYATKTKVEVKIKLQYKTTKASFDNDENAKSASIKAFKKSLNQSKAVVVIDEVKTQFIDTDDRRRLAIVEGIEVTYKTTVIAESTGLSSEDLYTQMQTSITTSVTEGSFSTNLAEAFEEFDVAEVFTAEDTVVVEAAVVDAALTHAPTHAPAIESTASDSSSSTTVIIIICVVVAVVLFMLAVGVFCMSRRQSKQMANVSPG